jgi:hypothetical protein
MVILSPWFFSLRCDYMALESGQVGPPGGQHPVAAPGGGGAAWWVLAHQEPPSGGSWLQYFLLNAQKFLQKFQDILRTLISAQKQHHGNSAENSVSPG